MNRIKQEWLFPKDVSEAIRAQKEMVEKVILKDCFQTPIQRVAGMDVSNTPFDPQQMVFGAAVVLSFPALEVIEVGCQAQKQRFPYISGLLGFREAPPLIDVYQELSVKPDLLMVDGHGIAHPRKLGIASQIGVLLDIPTIGVGKSILVGIPACSLGEEVGSIVPLVWKGDEIGRCVRTKKNCLPLIISSGHRVSLDSAIELVLACSKKFRLPETTRMAHLESNRCRQGFVSR